MAGESNLKLYDDAIRHALMLRRYEDKVVEDVVGFLNRDVYPDLLGLIRARVGRIQDLGFDSGFVTTERYKSMLVGMTSIIEDGTGKVFKKLKRKLGELAEVESQWQMKALENAVPNQITNLLEFNFTAPSSEMLRSIVTSRPFDGLVLKDWVDTLEASTSNALERQINIGLAQSQSLDQIIARIRGTREGRFENGVLQTSRKNAEAIARTVTNHVATQAHQEVYGENGDLVKGIRLVAVLDNRTTIICASLDGKIFPLDSGPRPPLHYNCRTIIVAVLKSYEELGFKNVKVLTGTTRASMNGQVPIEETFPEWLERQPAATQDEVLGFERAELFRSGEAKIEDMVDQTWQPITLKMLKKKLGLVA